MEPLVTIVLVVDEDAMARAVTAGLLRSLGRSAVPAASTDDALETFGAHHADIGLVLADAAVARAKGDRLLRELHAINARVPIMLMAAASSAALSLDGEPITSAPGGVQAESPLNGAATSSAATSSAPADDEAASHDIASHGAEDVGFVDLFAQHEFNIAGVLRKPFDSQELGAAVRRALQPPPSAHPVRGTRVVTAAPIEYLPGVGERQTVMGERPTAAEPKVGDRVAIDPVWRASDPSADAALTAIESINSIHAVYSAGHSHSVAPASRSLSASAPASASASGDLASSRASDEDDEALVASPWAALWAFPSEQTESGGPGNDHTSAAITPAEVRSRGQRDVEPAASPVAPAPRELVLPTGHPWVTTASTTRTYLQGWSSYSSKSRTRGSRRAGFQWPPRTDELATIEVVDAFTLDPVIVEPDPTAPDLLEPLKVDGALPAVETIDPRTHAASHSGGTPPISAAIVAALRSSTAGLVAATHALTTAGTNCVNVTIRAGRATTHRALAATRVHTATALHASQTQSVRLLRAIGCWLAALGIILGHAFTTLLTRSRRALRGVTTGLHATSEQTLGALAAGTTRAVHGAMSVPGATADRTARVLESGAVRATRRAMSHACLAAGRGLRTLSVRTMRTVRQGASVLRLTAERGLDTSHARATRAARWSAAALRIGGAGLLDALRSAPGGTRLLMAAVRAEAIGVASACASWAQLGRVRVRAAMTTLGTRFARSMPMPTPTRPGVPTLPRVAPAPGAAPRRTAAWMERMHIDGPIGTAAISVGSVGCILLAGYLEMRGPHPTFNREAAPPPAAPAADQAMTPRVAPSPVMLRSSSPSSSSRVTTRGTVGVALAHDDENDGDGDNDRSALAGARTVGDHGYAGLKTRGKAGSLAVPTREVSDLLVVRTPRATSRRAASTRFGRSFTAAGGGEEVGPSMVTPSTTAATSRPRLRSSTSGSSQTGSVDADTPDTTQPDSATGNNSGQDKGTTSSQTPPARPTGSPLSAILRRRDAA